MKQKSLIIFTLVLAMLMAFTLSATAGNFGGKHHKRGMGHGIMELKFLKALNLTDEQKKMTAEIISSYKEQIKTNLENMTASKKVMADTIFNQGNNEDAVRQAFQDNAKQKEEMIVLRAKILTELKNKVLTQDQLKELETMRAERQQRMGLGFEKKWSGFEEWLENLGQNNL